MRKLQPREMDRAAPEVRHPIRVVVENVRSAFNVGSILRTADALGLEEVILTGYTPGGDHPRVHKAALGAQDSVPWVRVDTVAEAVRRAREAGCSVAALEITDEPIRVAELQAGHFPLCLVVGNEVDGVSDEALALCDMAIEIPQFGEKHSLNVAVAFGVAGYDLVRRYRSLTGARD